jgi:hypothetical protein
VAVVQCRTIGVSRVGDSHINRLLVQSIDAFHVFLQVWARFGWMPFIGHNALLRMSAVRTVGGFTPGCFADDVDITVRLNLAGYRVVYAPDVRMAETHPASYRALRKRSYKWAYGCIQALKAHAFRVVSSRRLTVAEKLGFFQFTGFYVGQALVLMYLMLSFVVAPLLAPSMTPALLTGLVLGAGVAVGVYIPVVVYFWREGRLVRSFPTVLLFGLTYGATDFACTRGVWDSIRNRVRSWIPTNVALGDTNERVFVAEAAFGAALLLVPLWFAPGALWVPSAYLFGGKFLFSPALARWYDPRQANRRVTRQLAASLTTACLIALVGGFMLVPRTSRASSTNTVEVRGKDFVVDGQPFSVKGVHYGPWRPGTGPGRHYPYPDRASVEADLEQIVSLNANTILVFDAPGWVLDVAHAHGLRVLYTIRLNWQHLPFDENLRAQVAARVQELRSKPALLAWLLGNEVPSAALNNGGAKMVSDELATLYQVVKTVDSVHPISHSNWVTTKDLDLRFLDFVSFNVYPLWPPQVVALGYDHYIERVLRPIAGDKLLLMTEFGVNTIEAGEAEQAAILTKTWEALRRTDAAGGVVMEFADEWWKNYDNPRDRRDWWDRTYAPHDELTQDNDPEEAYGLVTAQRVPKLAFAAVQQMFADQPSRNARTLPALIVLLLISVSSLAWLLGRGLPRLGSRNETPTRLQGRL